MYDEASEIAASFSFLHRKEFSVEHRLFTPYTKHQSEKLPRPHVKLAVLQIPNPVHEWLIISLFVWPVSLEDISFYCFCMCFYMFLQFDTICYKQSATYGLLPKYFITSPGGCLMSLLQGFQEEEAFVSPFLSPFELRRWERGVERSV